VLRSIEWCRQQGLKYVYLGLYVEGNQSMLYKASFHPHQRRYRGQAWSDMPAGGWAQP
jgi:arginine-tRNA-protein transferase